MTLTALVNKRFWLYSGILLVCWAPWIIAHLPGAVDADTLWQAFIWRTPEQWYDHHPWLTTMIFGAFLDMGAALGSQSVGIAAYSILQSICTALAFAFMFSYARSFQPPKLVLYLCMALVAILPLYASFASEMVKDALFGVVWVPWFVLFIESVRTKGEFLLSMRHLCLFALLGVFVALTRKTGIYIELISLLFLLLYLMPSARVRLLSSLAFLLAVFLLWSCVLLPAVGVAKGPSKELFSLPLQQTARYVSYYQDEVTQDEKDAISKVLPFDALSSLYTEDTADPVKDNFQNPDMTDLLEYLSVWASMGLKHPLCYLQATFGTNSLLFNPLSTFQLNEDINEEWVNAMAYFSQFLQDGLTAEEIELRDNKTLEGVSAFACFDGMRTIMHKFEALINHSPIRLINTPFFMVVLLPLLLLIFACTPYARGHRLALLLALLPLMLLFASIIAGPMVLSRYCLPSAYIAPILATLPWALGIAPCVKTQETPKNSHVSKLVKNVLHKKVESV